MQITEQFILPQAPNAAAVENGRKLAKKGSFVNHHQTEDATLYMRSPPQRIQVDL